MIVPSPAGGQTDVMARLMAQKMQQSLGQSVIIENRAGAGGALAARAAASADPDGYTLFYGNTSTLAVIPAGFQEPGYDPVKNYAPVASVSESYTILVVHPSFPAKTMQEFLAYAKAQSGQVELRPCRRRQRDPSHRRDVPHARGDRFRQCPAQGRQRIRAGRPRQTGGFRAGKPGHPPVADQGRKAARARRHQRQARRRKSPRCPPWRRAGIIGFVATLLTGVVAPAGTPLSDRRQAQQRHQCELMTADMKELVVSFGSEARIGSPQEFAAFLAGETQKWASIAKGGCGVGGLSLPGRIGWRGANQRRTR